MSEKMRAYVKAFVTEILDCIHDAAEDFSIRLYHPEPDATAITVRVYRHQNGKMYTGGRAIVTREVESAFVFPWALGRQHAKELWRNLTLEFES